MTRELLPAQDRTKTDHAAWGGHPKPGLGPRRTEASVERFLQLSEPRQASEENIAAIPSISRDLARQLRASLF